MSEEPSKKIIFTFTPKGCEVKFKGEFFSVRDLAQLRRALQTQYRVYTRTRALTRRKGASNA